MYYRKSDSPILKEMLDRHTKEDLEAIKADTTGEGYILDMFSEELAILDRNTVKYMMDEMQSTIDRQTHELQQKQATIDEMHEKYTAGSIKNTISILRSLKLSDQEIIQKLCEQYQMNEALIQQYL